jgi:hypothetical protein
MEVCVEMVQHGMANRKGELSHFLPKSGDRTLQYT